MRHAISQEIQLTRAPKMKNALAKLLIIYMLYCAYCFLI